MSERVLASGLDDVTIGVYVEQPYRHAEASLRRVTLAAELRPYLSDEPRWEGARSGVDAIHAKQRAVSAYRSQLRWLELGGTRLARMLLSEAIRGGEALAWIKPVSLSLGARSKATTP